MKKTPLILLLALVASLAGSCTGRQTEKESLTIMSYNVRNGAGMDDSTCYKRSADVITKNQPDVVAIQELDSMTNRSRQHYVLKEIGDLTGMHPLFAPAIDYDGGKYGIGILSKEKPLRYHAVALPGREEARTLLVAEFEKYLFCCMHLSLTEEDRMLSLETIRKEAKAAKKPFFIAGDWNATPQDAFIKELQKDFAILSDMQMPTFPADKPDSTLDYIAVSLRDTASITRLSGSVINEPTASDHRPIITVVELD